MEGMNNITGAQNIIPITNQSTMTNQTPQPQSGQAPPPPPPPMIAEISEMGQLFSTAEETGDSAMGELKLFVISLFDAMQSGNFDAETLADTASDTIKEIADEAGIDLVAALNELEENAPRMNSTFPQGPPPNGNGHQGPPPPPVSEVTAVNSDEDSSYHEDILTDDAKS